MTANNAFTVTRDDKNVITITLTRPDLRNAFDDVLIEGLTNTLAKLQQDNTARALILTGQGKAFSAGADLNWMKRMATYTEEENRHDSARLGALMHQLYHLPFPTIARVNGPALGGGVGLIACCDMAITIDTAFFALSEARLGLIPAVISPFVIDAIGKRQALRYFQTAERFSARQAEKIGLVHGVVAETALDEEVDALIANILSAGPRAVRASKRLAKDVADAMIDDLLLEDTAARIAAIRVSREGQEGLSAFLEKRKPRWTEV